MIINTYDACSQRQEKERLWCERITRVTGGFSVGLLKDGLSGESAFEKSLEE